MSTDWDAVCFTCRTYTHLGQRFTSGPAFGYGSNDAQGRLDAAEFIAEHVYHDLRIMLDAPDGFTKHELPDDRQMVEPKMTAGELELLYIAAKLTGGYSDESVLDEVIARLPNPVDPQDRQTVLERLKRVP